MKSNRLTFLFIIMQMVIGGCGFNFTPQNQAEYIASAVEKTMQARSQVITPQTIQVLQPELAAPTPTALFEAEKSNNNVPCLQAILIGESIPDGSKMNWGESFTKMWRIRNTGTCEWNKNFKLVFDNGDQMGATESIQFNKAIPPGSQIEITTNLKAPSSKGTYTGYWKIQTDKGLRFAKIWTQIQVTSSKPVIKPTIPPEFTITGFNVSVTQDSSGDCPVTITVSTDVIADGPGEVELEWDSADGMGCGFWKHFITFDAAGTKTVQDVCAGVNNGPFGIQILIANRTSGGYDYYDDEYIVNCTPIP